MNKKGRMIVLAVVLLAFVFLVAPASASFNASSDQDTLNWRVYATTPINLANTSGGTWVNWTWEAGTGRIPPSSWNVSINGTDYNGTTTLYYNQSGVHWINITVGGWNATDEVLSEASVSGQEEIPNHVPSTPSLVSPSNLSEINDVTPFFNWTTSTDADGDTLTYTLQIDNESSFSSPYVYENTSITQSNHTLATGDALTDGINYTWRVRVNDTYTDSSWATFYNFTLDMVQPTISNTARSPSSVLVGDPVTITCTVTDDVSGVENVTVQIKNPKDVVTNYTLTAGASNTFSYEYTLTGKNGDYLIQYFRSYDEAGNLKEEASTLFFSAIPYTGGGAPGAAPAVTATPTPVVNVTAILDAVPSYTQIKEYAPLDLDFSTLLTGMGLVYFFGFAFLLVAVLSALTIALKSLKEKKGNER